MGGLWRSTCVLALFGVAACSEAPESESLSKPDAPQAYSVQEPPMAGADAAPPASETEHPIAVSAPNAPKIAYTYDYGFRLPADRMVDVQRKHTDLCEKKGPQVCRILEMNQSGGEGDYASGTLNLAVAAPQARAFGLELAKVAADADGTQVDSAIAGEDLSKQIVDTEARLRARTLLRDRLMEVLATRKGTVAELVEAERGVAQVNEEIDQARSWLAEMQGRVAFSRVNLTYSAGARAEGGFLDPVRSAISNVGPLLGMILAVLIILLTVAIPLGLVGLAVRFVTRALRRRSHAANETDEAAPMQNEASAS